MPSFSRFPLNDAVLNEILKKFETIENIRNKVKIRPNIFFLNETVEIRIDSTKCGFVIHRCFETIGGSGN